MVNRGPTAPIPTVTDAKQKQAHVNWQFDIMAVALLGSPIQTSPVQLMPMKHVANICTAHLITVSVWLVGAINGYSNVISLLFRQFCEFSPKGSQVQSGDLLVEAFWQQVDVVLVTLVVLPIIQQIQLAEHLVRKGARHHERWVASGTSEVQQAARREDNDAMTVREHETVHLRLDVLHLDPWELFKLFHLDLVIEVADVANDGVVLHLLHVLQGDNLEVACGGHEGVHLVENALNLNHLEALHACLQRADRITFCDQHTSARATHREGAAFA